MPHWEMYLIILPMLGLGALMVCFTIAILVEWYRGWPNWPWRTRSRV